MFGRKFRSADISVPLPQSVGSKDPKSATVSLPSPPLVMLAVRPAAIGTPAMTPLDQPPAPSAGFAPNSWPNSGFRNIRQKGTRGR
jgi:hypothetical protein